MHVLAQALPFLQVITVTTIALAAHLPTVAGALYLRSYNPGKASGFQSTFGVRLLQKGVSKEDLINKVFLSKNRYQSYGILFQS